MKEAEAISLFTGQTLLILVDRLKQMGQLEDIRFYENCGTLDGTVDVGLSRKIHHGIDLHLPEQPGHELAVTDSTFHKSVTRMIGKRFQIVRISGISQGIEVDDPGLRSGLEFLEDIIAPNEPTASRDQNGFRAHHLIGSGLRVPDPPTVSSPDLTRKQILDRPIGPIDLPSSWNEKMNIHTRERSD